jgi:formylmethanofuran dehydrogenase subunit C
MPFTLTLREPPTVPLETEGLTPDRLGGRRRGEIEALTVWHGNRQARLGDFFAVSSNGDEELRIEGDLRRVKFLGAGMTAGRLIVTGASGMHTGAEMRGGELVVEGDVGDFAGTGMRGGRLLVQGSAGHQLGGAAPGDRAGVRGGEILVHGNAGDQVGAGLRRGLIAVAGRIGDAACWPARSSLSAGLAPGRARTCGEARLCPCRR